MYHHHLLLHLLPACLLPVGQTVLAHDGGHRRHVHLAAVAMSRWGGYKPRTVLTPRRGLAHERMGWLNACSTL